MRRPMSVVERPGRSLGIRLRTAVRRTALATPTGTTASRESNLPATTERDAPVGTARSYGSAGRSSHLLARCRPGASEGPRTRSEPVEGSQGVKGLDRASEQALRRLAAVLRAGSHPTRLRELARFLGTSLSSITYHVHALADARLVQRDGTSPVRGAVEHFYKPTSDAKSFSTSSSDFKAQSGVNDRPVRAPTCPSSVASLSRALVIRGSDP
jgi:hypothetical protein